MSMRARVLCAAGVVALQVLAACGGPPPLPQTRTVIVFSGERIQTNGERMQGVERWLRPVMEEIELNPSFLIDLERDADAAYPWDVLELDGDTATITVERAAVDVDTPHLIYAFLRLMAVREELNEWIPELEDEEEQPTGLELEKTILKQVADVWLLGRSVYDTHAYGPLDELLYATEAELLEPFILATQGDRFPEEVERFSQEHPEWEADLREFFRRTFERDGPGYLPTEEPSEEPAEEPAEGPTVRERPAGGGAR